MKDGYPYRAPGHLTPMLFTAPMVLSILASRKTQTRRILGNQDAGEQCSGNSDWRASDHAPRRPGDRVWVREEHYRFGHWEAITGEKARTRLGRQRWRFVADADEVLFEAPAVFRRGRHAADPARSAWHKRLARFMPRALSRIMLEITAVRVERLRDISDEDAKAEGIEWGQWEEKLPIDGYKMYGGVGTTNDPRLSYRTLWEAINGPGGWVANPWVWVITFRRCLSSQAEGSEND